MAIHFSIAKRGLLPTEEAQQNPQERTPLKNLRPQLECPRTVDAVKFQKSSVRLPSVVPESELMAVLSTMQRIIVHEFAKGNAVTLPGIGTFRPTLKGSIEMADGTFHGKDVRVDGIRFRPDKELLEQVQGLEVEQEPFGYEFRMETAGVEERLAELFSRKQTVTHKDVAMAFEQTLTRGRVAALLRRLVAEGRIKQEGKGAQTQYRLA